jgi:molybdopterin converting factor small subunit
MANVWIPALLRDLTGDVDIVQAQGQNVREIIADLDRQFPGLKARLVQDDRIKPGLAVVVGADVARLGLDQPVAETSEIHFVNAIGGGGGGDG